jgi:hypothetical protein
MIVDDDAAVARLRRESAVVHVAAPAAESVLRRVHERRRVQRQHRMQAIAALGVVVVAVAGALLVGRDPTGGPHIDTAAKPVAEWPVRGSLAGDAELIARAEQTWRGSPHRPSGAVRALFAGTPPYSGTANFAVVALASAEGSVAFVTTAVARKVDTGELLLRSVTRVADGQPAIGFIASGADPRDAAAGVAFALAAPGSASPEVRSSAVDTPLGVPHPLSDGSLWQQVPPGVGAWNSVLEVPGFGVAAPAAGLLDPPTGPVRLRQVVDGHVDGVAASVGVRDGLIAEDAAPGDLIVTPDGVLGVVTDSLVIDTSLSALGEVTIPRSGVSGTLSDDGVLTARGSVNPTNRVVLARGDVEVVVGRVTGSAGDWRVERAVDPGKLPDLAMRVSLR